METSARFGKTLRKILLVLFVVVVLSIIIGWIGITLYCLGRFEKGTIINEMDCSMMTPDETVTAFTQNLSADDEVCFIVYLPATHGGMCTAKYCTTLEDFDLGVKRADAIEELLNKQRSSRTSSWVDILQIAPKFVLEEMFNLKPEKYQKTKIEDLIGISKEKVVYYLHLIPSLNEDYMEEGENAYIRIYGNYLKIVPEKMGNVLKFDDAVDYAVECFKNGNYTIDFTTLVTPPEITRNNERLVKNVETVNGYLAKTIVVQLANGSEITLDSNRMKDWIQESTENEGEFILNIDEYLPNFVDLISDYVRVSSNRVSFKAGEDEITVSVNDSKRVQIDKDKQFEVIKQLIMSDDSQKKYVITPEYSGDFPLVGTLKTYIALSIQDQTVWAYDNGNLILKADCVTGNVKGGHSTPTGIYYLTYKTTDATLRGYNDNGTKYESFVNFWMPFNGGIGFHDASWRYGNFGGNIYKTNGSHGCVNMRYDDAETLYNFITTQIPIIVF